MVACPLPEPEADSPPTAQRPPVAVGSPSHSGLPDKAEPPIDADMAFTTGHGFRDRWQQGERYYDAGQRIGSELSPCD